MAFDETFKPRPNFDEIVVFDLIGRTEQVRELRPSNFEGPVAEWAEERMSKIGETIVPRHVYVDSVDNKDHRVAWVYHDGIDMETGQSFCMHHVACDCSLEVDRAANEEERQEIIGNCPALVNVLRKRAQFINATYSMDTIIGEMYDPERPAEKQSSATQHFVVRSLVYVLEHDYRHPESWMANVESGWNMVGLLSNILHLRYEDVQWYAELLASQELVETDGTVVSLSQNVRDTIDADKVLREVASNFETGLAA